MISLRSMLVGLGTMLAVAVPMVGQADAATKTVRLHASTATGESLQGPISAFGTSVSLAPTNVNASRQKWQKTDVGGGLRDLQARQHASGSSTRCACRRRRQHAAVPGDLQPGEPSQHWTRGFTNDGRFDNRATLRSLTRQSNGHRRDALPRRRPGRPELARARRLIDPHDTGEGHAPSPVAVRLARTHE